MKKSKLLVGAMALSLALMGTGYAWWADAVTVQGTVNTGMMDVTISQVKADPIEDKGNDKYVSGENVVALGQGKEVELEVNNMYPNAHFKMDVTAKNIGTIGVKLGSILPSTDSRIASNQQFIEHLRYSVTGEENSYKPLQELNADLMALKDTDAEIMPDGEKTYTIFVEMPDNDPLVYGAENKFEDVKNNAFCLQFNWVQFNYDGSAPGTAVENN